VEYRDALPDTFRKSGGEVDGCYEAGGTCAPRTCLQMPSKYDEEKAASRRPRSPVSQPKHNL
jgi:hypothetical protein